MANGIYKITEEFEKALSDYTGAPYVVTVDNQSNALFLALYYEKNIKKSIETGTISIPSRTYPSVPCEIIHNGLKVLFDQVEGNTITGRLRVVVVSLGEGLDIELYLTVCVVVDVMLNVPTLSIITDDTLRVPGGCIGLILIISLIPLISLVLYLYVKGRISSICAGKGNVI